MWVEYQVRHTQRSFDEAGNARFSTEHGDHTSSISEAIERARELSKDENVTNIRIAQIKIEMLELWESNEFGIESKGDF